MDRLSMLFGPIGRRVPPPQAVHRTSATLLFVALLPALFARANLEDKALAAEFGVAWEAYRDRVPGWIPRLRSTSR